MADDLKLLAKISVTDEMLEAGARTWWDIAGSLQGTAATPWKRAHEYTKNNIRREVRMIFDAMIAADKRVLHD
jgi:hypothetical protein